MNWYKESQKELPIEETNYDLRWGWPHDKFEIPEDQMGLYSNFPEDVMPLPQTLYHVTPFADKIQEEGFKTFTESEHQTFGGHGTYVSFTTFENASNYQEGLKDFIKYAKEVKNADIREEHDLFRIIWPFMQKWEISSNWFKNIIDQYKVRQKSKDAGIDELKKIFFESLGHAHIFRTGDKRFPLFLNSGNVALRLSNLSPDDVKIIKVETYPLEWHSGANISPQELSGQDRYSYNSRENEWRIWNPDRVKVIEVLD